jgi:hypothetical protein
MLQKKTGSLIIYIILSCLVCAFCIYFSVLSHKNHTGSQSAAPTKPNSVGKQLLHAGFNTVFAPGQAGAGIPPVYRSIEKITRTISRYEFKYPDLVHVETIGKSTAWQMPINAIKVSDNAGSREDEPRILFVGVHHAREPIGANICLDLIGRLCEGYYTNDRIKKWLDEIEVWFVPVLNPDGYKYIHDNNLGFPWWRKNLRDNDGDGVFNPLVDGVDLNRNYNYNWTQGGDGKPGSWFYRGRKAFSESETQALRRFAIRENFVIGISYHSYGESVLYPWGNFNEPPDMALIYQTAKTLASKIKRETGKGSYSILPLNGRVGQSSIWMYGKLAVIDYIVEVGTKYYPDADKVPSILYQQFRGASYLLDRVLGAKVYGHVFDFYTRRPLQAEVEVVEYKSGFVNARRTDSIFGRFDRLLIPGEYVLDIVSEGYKTKRITGVNIRPGEPVELDVALFPEQDRTHGSN